MTSPSTTLEAASILAKGPNILQAWLASFIAINSIRNSIPSSAFLKLQAPPELREGKCDNFLGIFYDWGCQHVTTASRLLLLEV